MRVFLDTNVLIAAYATRGLCADVVRLVLAEHELVTSPAVLEEVERVLAGKLRLPADTTKGILLFLRTYATLGEATSVGAPVPVRDASDARVLAEAIAAGAEVLVSGDDDLLVLKGIPHLRIVTPREFWTIACGGQ